MSSGNNYDVKHAYQTATNAIIIANHMDAFNHAMLTCKEFREYITKEGIDNRVLVLSGGETIKI